MKRTNRRKDIFHKTRFVTSNFEKLWYLIIADPYANQQIDQKIIYLKNYEKDDYFQQIPFLQDFLTFKGMVSHTKIEYSNFLQSPSDKINSSKLYDCFHGILFYIFYYSDNKFNTEELEFHFSKADQRKDLTSVIQKSPSGIYDQMNILNIFNYENINDQFQIDCSLNAFFGVTFKRIKVNPIAYSIRSGPSTNNSTHLVSFIFEGYDEENQIWDILDERVNINNLIPSGSFALFYVRSTSKSFSSFRIRQIEPGHNGFWGFSIAAFDIHGNINLRDDFDIQNDSLLSQKEIASSNCSIGNDQLEYDPLLDMTEYLD